MWFNSQQAYTKDKSVEKLVELGVEEKDRCEYGDTTIYKWYSSVCPIGAALSIHPLSVLPEEDAQIHLLPRMGTGCNLQINYVKLRFRCRCRCSNTFASEDGDWL